MQDYQTPNSEMAHDEAAKSLLERLQKLHNAPALADFTITCQGREWKVHRLVISVHSPVLEKMCTSGFRETNEREVDVSDDLPECIDAMINYMYKLDYESPAGNQDLKIAALQFHVRMCILADKYDVTPLKTIALDKFNLDLLPSILDRKLALALVEPARIAYTAPAATTEIRERIISYVLIFMKGLGGEHPLCKLMQVIPEFAMDYATALEAKLEESRLREEETR